MSATRSWLPWVFDASLPKPKFDIRAAAFANRMRESGRNR
jgi:hypothetical protein